MMLLKVSQPLGKIKVLALKGGLPMCSESKLSHQKSDGIVCKNLATALVLLEVVL